MYDGYMLAQRELGYSPSLCDTYFCFRELVGFFKGVRRGRRVDGRGEMFPGTKFLIFIDGSALHRITSEPTFLFTMNAFLRTLALLCFFSNAIAQVSVDGETPVLVKDLSIGEKSTEFSGFTSAIGLLFFTAKVDGEWAFYRSDGTERGTFRLLRYGFTAGNSYATGKLVFFVQETRVDGKDVNQLWRTDGTVAGTYKLLDNISHGYQTYKPCLLGNRLFFAASDKEHGNELWSSDGTIDGTHIADDVNPTKEFSSSPCNFVSYKGALFFIATKTRRVNLPNKDYESIVGLYSSTGSGSVLIKEIGNTDSALDLLYRTFGYADKGLLYFGIYTQDPPTYLSLRINLWRSDGSEGGTFPIHNFSGDIIRDIDFGYTPITSVDSTFYFWISQYNQVLHSIKLYRTDGTISGTYAVADSLPVVSVRQFRKKVYFQKKDALWRTDGTKKGTELFRKWVSQILPINDENAFFVYGNELWKTDGTDTGTSLVRRFSRSISSFIAVKDTIYLGVDYKELWRSDGTSRGTKLVKSFDGKTAFTEPIQLVSSNQTLYTVADDRTYGRELWRLGQTRQKLHYRHSYNNPQNPTFFQGRTISEAPPFKVCADGSQSSVFKIWGGGLDYTTITLIDKDFAVDASKKGVLSRLPTSSRDTLIVKYTHPTDLDSKGKASIGRSIYLLQRDLGGDIILDSIPITVYRTPVLMVHGLWSNAEAFAKMKEGLIKSEMYSATPDLLSIADYRNTHAFRFEINIPIIKSKIDDLITSALSQGIASGNVDYIGHSMGGILGRLYLQDDRYYRSGLHKLITINTPHSGSQIANFLLSHQSSAEICDIAIPTIMSGVSGACQLGAVEDLKVDGPGIMQLLNGENRNKRVVPSHAIAKVSKSIQLPDENFIWKVLQIHPVLGFNMTLLSLLTKPEKFYQGENDLIVSKTSQLGGLGACTTTITGQIHLGSPANEEVIQRVVELLSESAGSDVFSKGFFPAQIAYRSPLREMKIMGVESVSSQVSITEPSNGSAIGSTQDFNIKVNGAGLNEIRLVVDYSQDTVIIARAKGESANFKIEAFRENLGTKKIVALGIGTNGSMDVARSEFLVVDKARSAPKAPTNLTAEHGATGALLKWKDESDNETSFELERRSSDSSFARVQTLPEDAMLFVDESVQFTREYFYRIRASNSYGVSAFSNVAALEPLILAINPHSTARAFPNPLQPMDYFTVSKPGALFKRLDFYDRSGKIVQSWTGSLSNLITVWIPWLPEGIYIAKAYIAGGEVISQKVIVR